MLTIGQPTSIEQDNSNQLNQENSVILNDYHTEHVLLCDSIRLP